MFGAEKALLLPLIRPEAAVAGAVLAVTTEVGLLTIDHGHQAG